MQINETELSSTINQLGSFNVWVNVINTSGDLKIIFVQHNTGKTIEIVCESIHLYKIARDPFDKDDSYYAGEVDIQKLPVDEALATQGWKFRKTDDMSHAWHLKIGGLVEIEIICLTLTLL